MARSKSSQVTLGVLLLVVGGILLATRFVAIEAAPAWMLGIGCALTAIAIVRRHHGALIGGMVLLGLGAGMVLGDRGVAGWRMGSWLLAGLAAAFIGFYLLALLLKVGRHPWPLVVGVALLAVVGARYLRDFTLLPPGVVMAVRAWWPGALVVVGLTLLIRGLRK
jgi:hypothetical protein